MTRVPSGHRTTTDAAVVDDTSTGFTDVDADATAAAACATGADATVADADLEVDADAVAESRSPPGQWRLFGVALAAWPLSCYMISQHGRGALCAIVFGTLGCLLLSFYGSARALSVRKHGQSAHRWQQITGSSRIAVSLLIPLCAVIVLLGARIHVAELQRTDREFERAVAYGDPVVFAAQLVGFEKTKTTDYGERSWVRIKALRSNGSVPMLLWLSEHAHLPPDAGPGTLIEVQAHLQGTPPADQAAYLATPTSVQVIPRTGSRLDRTLFAASGSTAARLRTLLVENASRVPGAELVPGLAVGDTSLVPDALSEAMLESSLTHIVAVSGSNTGLVVAAALWCASRIGLRRRARVLVAGGGLLMFITVVGPDASVQRASVMALVLLASAFGGKRAHALPALGLAMIVLLTSDPWQALQAGFALSVVATAGILLWAEPLARWLRRKARFPAVLALPLAVALAAQLSCGPILLLLQPGIPAIGVIANVIAAPAAPLGTGLGLIAAVLGPLSPELAHLAIQVARLPASWIAATAEVCAGLPAGRWNWPQGWPGALLLAACEALIFTSVAIVTGKLGLPWAGRVTQRAAWQPRRPLPPMFQIVATVCAASAISIMLMVTLIVPFTARLQSPKNWQMVACDVGQGDALIARDLRQPEEVMLIDTGDDADALAECLSKFGVKRISLLVLTHDDRDHVGALDAVIDRVDSALIAPTIAGEATEDREVAKMLSMHGVTYRIGYAGERQDSESGLSWQLLAPTVGEVITDKNSASLVMLLELGAHRALMLGDTGYEEQVSLLPLTDIRDVSIIKVAHHGSRDQALDLFVRAHAKWGIISVGADNRYGHPNNETIAAAERASTQTLRTDVLGDIAIVLQPDGSLGAWAEHTRR